MVVVGICGITGLQGGAVADICLENNHSIVGITRNLESTKSINLINRGVKMVKGDYDNPNSLKGVFDNCDVVFVVTNFWEHMNPKREYTQAKHIVDSVNNSNVTHIIWSTLKDTRDYNDDIDYLTCNNEQKFSPNSLLKNKCNHKKCCFNTKCSSNDVKELKESELSGNDIHTLCPNGKKFKHYSNCRDIENCRDNFELYCCSSEIDQEVQDIFNSIDTDNDNKISKAEINTYLGSEYSDSLTDLNINKLNKLLAVDTDNELQTNASTNIQLDVYEFNDLLNE